MRKANKDAAKNNLTAEYFPADRALQKKLLDECLKIRSRYLFLDRTYGEIIRKYPNDVRPLICRIKAVTQSNILYIQHRAYFYKSWGTPGEILPSYGTSFINWRRLCNFFRHLSNLFFIKAMNRSAKESVKQNISFIKATKERPPVDITNPEDIEKIKEACDECLEKLRFVLKTGKFEGVFDEGLEKIHAVMERDELDYKTVRELEDDKRIIAEMNPFPFGRILFFCTLTGGIVLGWNIWGFWGAMFAAIVLLIIYGIVKDSRIESLFEAMYEFQDGGGDVTDE
ncbi:MAG: phage holin family protein [Synergistaceae bacterium]|nr:phage holin family protein [Synergistaceae bacterium]